MTEKSSSGKSSRRRFIGILAGLSISVAIIPTTYFFFKKRKKEIPLTSRSLINGDFKFFSPYQATVLDEVTSLIIPMNIVKRI